MKATQHPTMLGKVRTAQQDLVASMYYEGHHEDDLRLFQCSSEATYTIAGLSAATVNSLHILPATRPANAGDVISDSREHMDGSGVLGYIPDDTMVILASPGMGWSGGEVGGVNEIDDMAVCEKTDVVIHSQLIDVHYSSNNLQ